MRFRLQSYNLFARFGTWVKDKLPKSMESEKSIKAASEYHLQNCLDKTNCKCTEQSVRKKSRKELKLNPKGFSSLEKIDVCIKSKERPNYFVAVQISNHVVHDTVRNIQNHISSQDARLDKIMISLPTLHITLMVMYIGDEVTHMKAMKALTNVHKEFNDIMCNEPLNLEFNGLGHFGNKVLFAKIEENESYERLRNLNECVKTHFAEEEILSTDTRTLFTPHLTIAKIDFSCRKQRAIKKIDPLLYEKFTDHYIGSETVQSIQLLSMTKPKDDASYYTGDKLFFSLSDAC